MFVFSGMWIVSRDGQVTQPDTVSQAAGGLLNFSPRNDEMERSQKSHSWPLTVLRIMAMLSQAQSEKY